MRIATVVFYFILAIIIFASIGIWLPYCFEAIKGGQHSQENLIQNTVTYFIAILVSASLDYILKLIDNQNLQYRKFIILAVCLANVLIFFMTAFVLFKNSNGYSEDMAGLAVLGVVLSYIMWWIANYKNSHFNLTDPLGGDAKRELVNG